MTVALAPVWVTDAGSLGVAPEGKFYRLALSATDPNSSTITYTLIAGVLPQGVQVNTNGLLEGIPISVADVKGVPTEVAEDTTSRFAIRITNAEGHIADRTFSITISGQDKPEWITPPGSIGFWFDGTEMFFQFEVTDTDPGDEISVTLSEGSLPEGISLDSTGLLSGLVEPIPSGNQNFTFTLRLTDGKDVVLRTFSMFVYSHSMATADYAAPSADNDTITADSIVAFGSITADNSNITVDTITARSPYIVNHVPDLGDIRHDNYFAYKFIGQDPNGDQIQYAIVSGSPPPGLALSPITGYLSGDLPDIALTEVQYTFGIQIFKTLDPTNRSAIYVTTMRLIGNIDTEINWISETNLGTLDNGEISTLSVIAEHATADLFYSLKSGTELIDTITVDSAIPYYTADSTNYTADENSTIVAYLAGPKICLPQGLTLMPSGNIVGRASFRTFSLDNGTTTFDSDFATRLSTDPTTFDLTYTFTVEVHSPATEPYLISASKEFTILINNATYGPYNELYCKAMPPTEDRRLIESMLTNSTVIPEDLIYRIDDPFFASAQEVIYTHAYGLAPALIDDYFAALEFNHYNKNVVLGEIKIARALNADESVLYEVVYSQINDTYVNQDGDSPSREINIKYPAYDNGVLVNTVYPNSLENMREEVVDQIGQISETLPRWMLSKQTNGEILGFTPAWVIAYAQPGKGKLLQYKIQDFIGSQLNLIDFEIDRYTLDSRMSTNWEYVANATADLTALRADTIDVTADVGYPTVDVTDITADAIISVNYSAQVDTGRWVDGVQTTFDRIASLLDVTVDSNLVTADSNRKINPALLTLPPGYVPRDPADNQYETLYDGGCTAFQTPVDVVNFTDSGDEYVMFPKKTIINNER